VSDDSVGTAMLDRSDTDCCDGAVGWVVASGRAIDERSATENDECELKENAKTEDKAF
jgi:hypothetical protein